MKIFLKILKYGGYTVLGLGLSIFILLLLESDFQSAEDLQAQFPENLKIKKNYSAQVDSVLYQKLWEEYAQNKTLPKSYEWAALLALSHYPELKTIPIDFILQEAYIPLSSRPNPYNLLIPGLERRYIIVISTKSSDFFEPILIHHLPFNAQVGVLGHELAHTLYYLDKSALELSGIAFSYLRAGFRKEFERATDYRALNHGLGFQLYDYAQFVRQTLQLENMKEELGGQEEDTYLSPVELKEAMGKHSSYASF